MVIKPYFDAKAVSETRSGSKLAMTEISRTKKVLALSMGGTFNTIAFLVSSMIAARLLTKHDYATMKQTMLVYNFMAPLLMLGLGNVLYYFLPKEKENKKRIVIENIVLLTIMASLFSLVLLLGGAELIATHFDNPDLDETLKWMIPYPLFIMPVTVLGAILVILNKTYTLTMYNVISNFFLALLIIVGILYTESFSGPLLAQIYFPMFLLPIAIWLAFKYVSGTFSLPKKAKMVEMLKYSIPLGLAGMFGTLSLLLDKVIVSSMSSPEEFAIYVNGAIEIPLIGIITGSIASVILADMVKYIDKGDKAKALELFKKASVKSALILFPVMVFLFITAKPFIVTLFSEKYLESVVPFCIYLLALPVRIVFYGSALMALGETKAVLIRSIFDLIFNLLLSITLIYFIGYLGAAIATVLTLYFWSVPFNLLKIGKGFDVPMLQVLPFKSIFTILLISIFSSVFITAYAHNTNHDFITQLILSFMLYFPFVSIILYKFKYLIIPLKYEHYIPKWIRN